MIDTRIYAFNASHSIGTPVTYWPGTREGAGIQGVTRSLAFPLPGKGLLCTWNSTNVPLVYHMSKREPQHYMTEESLQVVRLLLKTSRRALCTLEALGICTRNLRENMRELKARAKHHWLEL